MNLQIDFFLVFIFLLKEKEYERKTIRIVYSLTVRKYIVLSVIDILFTETYFMCVSLVFGISFLLAWRVHHDFLISKKETALLEKI